jgi:hypothetical protein
VSVVQYAAHPDGEFTLVTPPIECSFKTGVLVAQQAMKEIKGWNMKHAQIGRSQKR